MGKGFALGFIVAVVLFAAGAYSFITLGLMPAGQDQKPGALETWAAKTSLRATVGRQAPSLTSPIQPTEPNLTAGAKLYVTHCQVCHGGTDAEPTFIAKGLNPDPPQLAKEGVEDDPEGVSYWKIAHGIRFTGMPAFRETLSNEQMWQLALFLKQMDKLPPATKQAWVASPTVR